MTIEGVLSGSARWTVVQGAIVAGDPPYGYGSYKTDVDIALRFLLSVQDFRTGRHTSEGLRRHVQSCSERRRPPMRLANSVEYHSCRGDNSPILSHPAADRTRDHSALVNAVCTALGSKRDLRIAKMSPGGEPTKSGKPARCGPPGLADICGIIGPSGRLFCLECKTGNAVQSRVQVAMMRVVRGLGGFYAVVRSVDDAEAAYQRAKRGERG